MKSIKYLLFAVIFSSILPGVASALSPSLSDPMAFAQESSLIFSEGDTFDRSGWNGCVETSSATATRKIVCEGSRTVLVFGGSPQSVPFTCEFHFERNGAGSYSANEELSFCE